MISMFSFEHHWARARRSCPARDQPSRVIRDVPGDSSDGGFTPGGEISPSFGIMDRAARVGERVIEARVHGRYLVRSADSAETAGLVVGFHGYAEDAAIHLNALSAIPGIHAWLIVSVQALHPFYTRDQSVVANWMTRQDREHAIVDNVDYVGRVLESVQAEHGVRRP